MNEGALVTEIKGIGEKTAKLFGKLQISRVGELLAYYPRSYEAMEAPVLLAEAPKGEPVSVRAAVVGTGSLRHAGSLSILILTAADESAQLQVTFFNMPYLKRTLKPGQVYVFRGVLKQNGKRLEMEHPRLYRPEEYEKLEGRLQPRYTLTAGLSNKTVSGAVRRALDGVADSLGDPLPAWLRKAYGLGAYREALEGIHFPASCEEMLKARKRLVFDEFLQFLLSVRLMKEQKDRLFVERPMMAVADTERFLEALPYRLTGAQQRVWEEIRADLQKETAMNRLIQGDVGSGKTILAFLALLMTAANGRQGVIMAPTEVLAKQHYETFSGYCTKYRLCVKPILLTGSMSAREKRDVSERIACGAANVIIGTHALIQERVQYRELALVVTDEQHRFGVRQREKLADKGEQPHVLVMSATPIPRTLAIILYGDLEVSVLDEVPAGRLPIKNCVVDTDYRKKAYEFLAGQAAAGRQAYVICPQVEEGETQDLENVTAYTEKLRAALPSSVIVESLHGRMKPAVKTQIMEAFGRHDIDILVSTTVIEVGIDVPNATVIMVENAERFGLAQLHQLRGRVGRGKEQSYCIFVTGSDNPQTMKRLEILNHSNDGFEIAAQDLKLRGPGDLFGIRQSGVMSFTLGDIYQDADILMKTDEAAGQLMERAQAGEEDSREYLEEVERKAEANVDFRTI